MSSDSPQKVWAPLIKPKTWWHRDHTYFRSAENLTLDRSASGLWLEH